MIDIAIIVIVVLSVISGLSSGLVRQAVSLIALVAAIVLGIQYADAAGQMAVSWLQIPATHATIVGFAAIFGGIFLAGLIVSRLVRTLLTMLRLGGIDRVAGGIFGGLKATLIMGATFTLLSIWDFPSVELRQKSYLYGPVMQVMEWTWEALGGRLPDGLRIPGITQ